MTTGIASPEETPATASLLTTPPPAGASHPLASLNAEGWETFNSLPNPGRKDEAWRFSTLKVTDLSGFTATAPASEALCSELLGRSRALEQTAGRMVFVNDALVARDLYSEELEKLGVIWKPLEQAAAEHPELFAKHFMAHGAELGGAKYAALHKASVRTGTFLYVPANVSVELPIEIFHWLSGEGNSSFPHTLVIVGENSKVTLVDYFQSADAEEKNLAIGVNDLHVADGASLTYVCVQEWSATSHALQINNTVVGKNASAKSLNVSLGSRYSRIESLSKLIGEGGRSDMLNVTVARGDQEFDSRTLQDHYSPGASSDLLYKNALDDHARTVFAGLIKVEEHAHRTDAYQKVRNLLLSDEAEANSAPGLEILADDVLCSHGATSGQVEPEELFYMLARGIDETTAQRLIVNGFLQEAVERLGNEAVEALIAERVAARFV